MVDQIPPEHLWRRSSRSGSGSDNCVEVAFVDDTVLIRNSQHPQGPILVFSREAWSAFIADLRTQ